MDYPLSRTYPDLLRELAERYPHDIAVIDRAGEMTFAELLQRTRLLAAGLRRHGLRRGAKMGMLAPNSAEWLVGCFAGNMVGATVVPFSTWSTREELALLIADSGVSFMLAADRFGDRDYVADLAAILESDRPANLSSADVVVRGDVVGSSFRSFNDFVADLAPLGQLPPGEGPSAEDDAVVLYTSGSSGAPKAVRLKHCGIIENGFNIGERQGLKRGDRVLLSAPLFWSFGGANALPAAFGHAATLVLLEKFDAGMSIEAIERFGCTAIYTLPAMTNAIIAHPTFDRSKLKCLRTGVTIGTPQDFMIAVNGLGIPELCNIYGATETYGNCTVTWHHWPVAQRSTSQGTLLPGQHMRFIDEVTGVALPPGEPGMVEVKGYISPGYSGSSSALNAMTFTDDGYYRTGDFGYLNTEGGFVFLARKTEMIKRAGINISPIEIEEVLRGNPAVGQVAVVGVPDPKRDEMIVAYVVAALNKNLTADELTSYCRSRMSKYKVPDRIAIVPSLPLTVTGKLERRELRRRASELVAEGLR